MRTPIAWLAFVFASVAAHAVHADEVPLLPPQWIAAQTEDELVGDRIAASAGPATIAMPDGGEVTVTVTNDEVVLRRYAPDGSVAQAASEPVDLDGDPEIVVQANTAMDALYVLAGGAQTPATLMRFDGTFGRQWSVQLPFESICERTGTCLRLALLDDGSVIAMRAYRVMRVGGDGQVRWNATDPNTANDFRGGDLAVGDAAIWVATTGGVDFYDPTATLARLDFDGMRLSADVSSCHGCGGVFLNDIELTGDGGARVVGSIGGHGLYARYDALGFPLLQATADAAEYLRLAHDATGAAYVLESAFPDTLAHRIDPSSGELSWSLPADDFVALDAGIATIRNTPATLEVAAVDAAGTPLWQRALTAGSSLAYRVATHPAYVQGRVELLAKDLAPSDDPCAIYPRFVRLDGAGNPTWFDRPCRTTTVSAMVWAVDARPDTGVLVDTLAHLALYSPNGDLRWRLHACEWCSGDAPSAWTAAALARDGGAWAMRWDSPSLADPDGRTSIERYDTAGMLLFAAESLVSGGSASNYDRQIAIRSGDSDLVMLFAGYQTLYWQRIADDGSGLSLRTFPVSDPFFYVEDAHRLPDGGTVVLTKGWGYCSVGCPPFFVTVLRIAANGDLVSRYEFPEAYAPWIPAAIDLDGDTAAILPRGDDMLALRKVRADGSVDADIPLGELGGGFRPEFVAALDDGSWLMEAYPSASAGTDTLWRIDDDGHVLAMRHEAPYLVDVESTSHGILAFRLVDPGVKDAVLFDPLSLADSARFYNGTGIPYGPRPWRMLDDGSVYGTITLPLSGIQAIARYSVPGTTPSDVIFRNAFD